jgi:hypothetical protein
MQNEEEIMQIIQEAKEPANNAKEEVDPSVTELAELDDVDTDIELNTSEDLEPLC